MTRQTTLALTVRAGLATGAWAQSLPVASPSMYAMPMTGQHRVVGLL